MGRRDVERLEVVPVVLDLGALGDPVAEPDEDVLELAPHLRHEVQVPEAPSVAPEREVDERSGRRARLTLELGPARRDELADGLVVRADGLTRVLALLAPAAP